MADWLIARGVDEGRILVEEQADNTEENVAYAKALLARHGVDAVSYTHLDVYKRQAQRGSGSGRTAIR